MGYYIEGPNKSKAEFIVSEYDGKIIPCPKEFNDIPKDKGLICVVDNGPFEAAGYCYDEREFQAFSNPKDLRPKKWLMIDRKTVNSLTHYVERK